MGTVRDTQPFRPIHQEYVAAGGSGSNFHPAAAVADSGDGLITYEVGEELIAQRLRDGSWLAPVVLAPVGVFATSSAANHQLAMNRAGTAAVVFRILEDGDIPFPDTRFGLAYYDGSEWRYVTEFTEGGIDSQFTYRDMYRSPVVTIDDEGVAAVAFVQGGEEGGPRPYGVARFDFAGLLDVAVFPPDNTIQDLYVAANPESHLILVDGAAAREGHAVSRIFDGETWSVPAVLGQMRSSPWMGVLNFLTGDRAQFLPLSGNLFDLQTYDGSWSVGECINCGWGQDDPVAGISDDGRMLLSWRTPFDPYQIVASTYDGSGWSRPTVVEEDAGYDERLRTFADGDGRWVGISVFSLRGPEPLFGRYLENGRWHGPYGIAAVDTDGILQAGYAGAEPAVAMNPHGTVLIVADDWQNNLYALQVEFRPDRVP